MKKKTCHKNSAFYTQRLTYKPVYLFYQLIYAILYISLAYPYHYTFAGDQYGTKQKGQEESARTIKKASLASGNIKTKQTTAREYERTHQQKYQKKKTQSATDSLDNSFVINETKSKSGDSPSTHAQPRDKKKKENTMHIYSVDHILTTSNRFSQLSISEDPQSGLSNYKPSHNTGKTKKKVKQQKQKSTESSRTINTAPPSEGYVTVHIDPKAYRPLPPPPHLRPQSLPKLLPSEIRTDDNQLVDLHKLILKYSKHKAKDACHHLKQVVNIQCSHFRRAKKNLKEMKACDLLENDHSLIPLVHYSIVKLCQADPDFKYAFLSSADHTMKMIAQGDFVNDRQRRKMEFIEQQNFRKQKDLPELKKYLSLFEELTPEKTVRYQDSYSSLIKILTYYASARPPMREEKLKAVLNHFFDESITLLAHFKEQDDETIAGNLFHSHPLLENCSTITLLNNLFGRANNIHKGAALVALTAKGIGPFLSLIILSFVPDSYIDATGSGMYASVAEEDRGVDCHQQYMDLLSVQQGATDEANIALTFTGMLENVEFRSSESQWERYLAFVNLCTGLPSALLFKIANYINSLNTDESHFNDFLYQFGVAETCTYEERVKKIFDNIDKEWHPPEPKCYVEVAAIFDLLAPERIEQLAAEIEDLSKAIGDPQSHCKVNENITTHSNTISQGIFYLALDITLSIYHCDYHYLTRRLNMHIATFIQAGLLSTTIPIVAIPKIIIDTITGLTGTVLPNPHDFEANCTEWVRNTFNISGVVNATIADVFNQIRPDLNSTEAHAFFYSKYTVFGKLKELSSFNLFGAKVLLYALLSGDISYNLLQTVLPHITGLFLKLCSRSASCCQQVAGMP